MTGSKGALIAGVDAITAEAAGVLYLDVVEQADALDLFAAALSGDTEAAGILRALEQAQAGILAAPKWRPMLCASCPAPLLGGKCAFVIATPATDGPHHALGLAVCTRCGPDRDAIMRKGVAALSRIWPDLRELTITHPEGGQA